MDCWLIYFYSKPPRLSLRSQTLHQKLVRLTSQTSAQNHPVPALRPLCSLILPTHPPSQPTKLTRNPSSVLIFIITILLLAADFYYLKNIAGRRLVGLRWWNEVDTATGDSRWVFESADPETRTINATDRRFFWLALYAQPVLWVILAIVALASFEPIWLTLVGELHPYPSFATWVECSAKDGWMVWKSLDSGCWRQEIDRWNDMLEVYTMLITATVIALILTVTNTLAFSRCDKFSQASNFASSAVYSSGLARNLAGGMVSSWFRR